MVLSPNSSMMIPPATANPNDRVNVVGRILDIARKINVQPATGTTTPFGAGTPSAEQLKQ